MYYDKLQLYEKEPTQIELEGEYLVLSYKSRRENTRIILDKYVVRTPEVVVMLFGKGDSIVVHDELKPSKSNASTR